MRTVYLFLVVALTLSLAGVAAAAPDCGEAKASASVKSASAEGVTPAEAKLACSAKKAAHAKAKAGDCQYCDFVTELRGGADKVAISTVENKNGLTVIFAAVTENDVEMAQTLASKAYEMINAPAHCSYTRAKMADKSCGGCKEGLGAFADATVSMEKTDAGAETSIEVKDKGQVEKLQAFFRNLEPVKETENKG